jgi:hypothetical protein
MTKFEELPGNHQALMLAKLALEMSTQNASNIHHLAKAQKTDVMSVWRAICRKAGQPVCTVPVAAMYETS